MWAYEGNLRTWINEDELKSAAIRSSYLDKMRVGSDECMAGKWPKGAQKGKSYHENGNMVTDACRGVSSELDFFGRFFRDNELWGSIPSSEVAGLFAKTYDGVFVKDTLTALSSFNLGPVALALAEEARKEIAARAAQVVDLKRDAAQTDSLLQFVSEITRFGLYWTVITSLGVIALFARFAGKIRF